MYSLRILRICVCLFVLAAAVFAQGVLGTITGTVTDATGAVVVNARVEAKNVDTGVIYPGVSTETGNYTISALPIGKYEVTVNVQGFKKYDRQGLNLAAAQIMVIDAALQVGSNTEAVTVTAEATLLKTESSELVHNVTGTMIQELPILALGGGGVGAQTSGFRDPFALVKLIPGIQYNVNSSIIANASSDKQIRVEGQVAGNLGGLNIYTAQTQPSVDAIQEVATQTSNYAAEYGTAGGAIINVSMRSGANQYHGSLYDYAVNEVLNAYPSMHQADRSKQRRHDYGGTLGGPVTIPKLYKGENKTFFFWSFEQYRENLLVNSSVATVPVDPYRVGNFTDVLIGSGVNGVARPIQVGGKNYIDPLGRTGFLSGEIFDPYNTQAVTCNTTAVPGANCTNGNVVQVRDPFSTINVVPQTAKYMNQAAYNLQTLFPEPQGQISQAANTFGNNYQNPWNSHRTSEIPSLKLDETVGSKGHVSFYWSTTGTESQYSFPNGNMEGFPVPITVARGTFIHARTARLNYDHTLTPSLLIHLGAGYSNNNFIDDAPVARQGGYNACLPFTTTAAAEQVGTTQTGGLGLCGAALNRTFPIFNIGASGTTGGMNSIGTGAQGPSYEQRPSGNANATWVKGNHTFKLGSEFRIEGYPSYGFTGTAGTYNFSGSQTSQTALVDTGGVAVSQGTTGFGYASYLMGLTSGTSLSVPTAFRQGKTQWALFLQDTWKITRKLTFDYGLRWDYGTYNKESYGRVAVMDFNVLNQNAGNHPGGSIYEATCGCSFASNYPYQIGPRVGIAYQINRKTVFRGGAGVVYQTAGFVGGSASDTLSSAPGPNNGDPSTILSNGINLKPFWPDFSPGSGFTPGSTGFAPTFLDPNSMRSPRIYQFSVGLQREIHRNLVVEASYVGNRGIWLSAGGLDPINTAGVALLNKYNFQVPINGNVTQADLDSRALLTSTIANLKQAQINTLAGQGVAIPPYSGYPTSAGVRGSILPFPQYPFGVTPTNAPLGHNWYDSLQVVATQRLTHGLSLNANYTYSKAQSATGSVDPFNPALAKGLSGNDIPWQFRFSADYTVPRIHSGNKILGNKVLGYIMGDWGLGWYMQYQSAGLLGRPGNVTGVANAVNPQSPDGAIFCPYTQGCANAISDWLGYGPGSAQLVPGANPWTSNWTDLSGVVHNTPIDINCHCYDPTKTDVFNRDAWVSVPTGVFAADQSSIRWFRGIRAPSENANISRNFRLKERMTLQIRVEFTNVFNRLVFPNPSLANYTSAVTQSNGLFTGGFGTFGNISPLSGGTGAGAPRTGLFIARLQF